jgi:hypothetical protein
MALGLRGVAQAEPDAIAYQALRGAVLSGDLVCYFSAVHVVEALRYEGTDPATIEMYCKVVDELTRGACIVWQLELERRELRDFIRKTFGNRQEVTEPFAYGKGLEAFTDPDEAIAAPSREVPRRIREQSNEMLRRQGLCRTDRRRILSRLPDLLAGADISSDTRIPGVPPAVQQALTPEVQKKWLSSSAAPRQSVMRKVLDVAVTFQGLLMFYRHRYEQLDEIGRIFDASADNLIKIIEADRTYSKALEPYGYEVEVGRIRQNLIDRAAKHFASKAFQVVRGCPVSRREIETELKKEGLVGIPSWDAAVSVATEYLRSNKGDSKRTLFASDLRDILHFRYLPYVDILVTDRYFASIGRPLEKRFKGRVVRNVVKLVEVLEARP